MKRIAVFIATTDGPVRVERITRERAPQSMVCLKRTSRVLPISSDYDSFVRRGSGVIERTFGPFEDGAFRLDVSAPIETGESWQLGFFLAHALCAAQSEHSLAAEEDADEVVWLTGHVDYDLAVSSVGHVAEKLHASRAAITRWLEAGRPVTLFVPEGSDHDALTGAEVPDGARVVALSSAKDAVAALGLPLPTPSTALVKLAPAPSKMGKGRVTAWLAGGLAAAVALMLQSSWQPMIPVEPDHEVPEPADVVAASPVEVVPVVLPAVSPAVVPAVLEMTEPAPPQPRLFIVERRAPPGHTGAQVQFGAAEAVEIPASGDSTIRGLCGLGLGIDNGDRPQFVALNLDVLSGKLLYGTARPEAFGGDAPFNGQQEWAIDLPRRLDDPFEIEVVAVSGDQSVADEAAWLSGQTDAAAAARELSAKGVGTVVLRHRVLP